VKTIARKMVRVFIFFVFLAAGLSLGYTLSSSRLLPEVNFVFRMVIIVLPGIIIGLIGYGVAPFLIKWVIYAMEFFENVLQKMPLSDLVGAAVGLIIGLIIASLLGSTLDRIPFVGNYIPIIASVLLGYLGLRVGMKKKGEVFGNFPSLPKIGKEKDRPSSIKIEKPPAPCQYKILDTSVIIDGRIADICKTGIIDGTLVIPGFILEELRHIADSSDSLKRNRGRRGLDILNKIRKELDVMVQILEKDFPDVSEVDSKLVRMAQEMNGVIVTNDYNLNKVAELQGVKVLNINELANALKPVYLPGEEMMIQIVKDGKETKQGIGYLDDGTMIVVESGKQFINQMTPVIVTSVLQTAAGRMIFAKPKITEGKGIYGVDAIG